MSADLSHITLDEGTGNCAVCKTGVTCPHSTHTKAGVANGLTATGRASKAARKVLGGDDE